jgi:hypothetical protein
VNNGPII